MKKRLLVVVLIVLTLGMFVACDESISTSLKGTWKSVETIEEEGIEVIVTTTMVLGDKSVTMNVIGKGGGVTLDAMSAIGTYTKTDSTITITTTSMTILDETLTGEELKDYMDGDVTETIGYSISKSGSTVTLTITDDDDVVLKLIKQ